MSIRKKSEIEFRFCKIPEGEHVLALFGERWRRTYGDDKKDIHFHNLMEIGLCLEGGGNMVFNNKVVPYMPGTLTVIPKNVLHGTNSWLGELDYWEYFFVDPKEILSMAYSEEDIFTRGILDKIEKDALCIDLRENEELKALIHIAREECKKRKRYSMEIIRSAFLSLLLVIARNDTVFDADDKKQLQKGSMEQIMGALNYISEHYAEKIRISELAGECSLSETYFRKVFHECMNVTPVEYLSFVRIQNACELLRKSRYSMDEVAQRVGYPMVSTFNRNFRKLVGTSPYQYKKNSFEGKLLNFKVSTKRAY